MKKAFLFFAAVMLLCLSVFGEECWSDRFHFDGSEITEDSFLLMPTDPLNYSTALAEGEPRSLTITVVDSEDQDISASLLEYRSEKAKDGKVFWNYTDKAYSEFPTDDTYLLTEMVESDVETKAFTRSVTILPEPLALVALAVVGVFFLRQKAKGLLVLLAISSLGVFGGRVEKLVSDVRCQQNTPFDRSVTIKYKLHSDYPDPRFEVKFYGSYDGGSVFDLSEYGMLSRDGAEDFVYGNGEHRTLWTPSRFFYYTVTDDMKIKVEAAENNQPTNTYMIIDLSGGTNAAKFAVSYRAYEPVGGWSEEYKTTKLVLRLVQPGTFTMGSPSDELGRYDLSWVQETQHQVTLTKPFYVGVFEVTQKQYELIMGSNPSWYAGDARPVEHISYETIRGSEKGAGWPNSNEVDENSFFGILRSKTGKAFDLPTEAQWEYACRAGTTTALNSGKNLSDENECSEANEVGIYYGNGGWDLGTVTVGSFLPNAWGLYDMHGNVYEWCLDWFQKDLGANAVTDPMGAATGSGRSMRGGAWGSGVAKMLRSASRDMQNPTVHYWYNGLRIVLVQ